MKSNRISKEENKKIMINLRNPIVQQIQYLERNINVHISITIIEESLVQIDMLLDLMETNDFMTNIYSCPLIP